MVAAIRRSGRVYCNPEPPTATLETHSQAEPETSATCFTRDRCQAERRRADDESPGNGVSITSVPDIATLGGTLRSPPDFAP